MSLRAQILGIGLCVIHAVHATVTIYPTGQGIGFAATATADAASYTGAAAYNPTTLNPPPVPSGLPTQFFIQLQNGGTPNISAPVNGSFLGFSVEMSVANQVLGSNSSFIQVPFLNLMANLQQRSGRVNIRVGGNTQETAVLVEKTSDGRMLEKNVTGASGPTLTPPLIYTPDLLYLMRNISGLVNVHWYLGVPFLLTDIPTRLAIAQRGQEILGDYLIGLQIGNEPDLYQRHERRTVYGPFDYFGDFGVYVEQMNNASIPGADKLIGPNIAYADWTTEQVWNTGFVDTYSQNILELAVENYPTDNCAVQFNTGGTVHVPQEIFPDFLSHNSGKGIIGKFKNSTNFAIQKGKRLVMFETNTASCGGFPGISDAFGAALWGIDYTMTMAANNFGGAMMHVGGQNVFYNLLLAPPTNQSTFHQWTVGPIYYSALVVAETLGPTNGTQVLDLNANGGNIYTPTYAIYENGDPVRIGVVNFVTDASGASDLNVTFAIGGSGVNAPNATPAQVKVKYLRAASVSQKGNYTWAGQTFGGNFDSDGRPVGEEEIITVPCDQATNVCVVKVPAPSYALIFLSDSAQTENAGVPTTTFPTSAQTKTRNTITVDPAVLATSNGGFNKKVGSTSPENLNSARPRSAPTLLTVLALSLGLVFGRLFLR